MNPSADTPTRLIRRLSSSGVIVTLFVLAMSACVLGLVVWKAAEARSATLARSEIDSRNLAHSLAKHAFHTLQAVDVVLADVVAALAYNHPPAERMNRHLRKIAATLPQIHQFGVIDASGHVIYGIYSDQPVIKGLNHSDRDYFRYHRDHDDAGLLISGPLQSRVSGQNVIALSKRLQDADGSFAGVAIAMIATDFFSDFYKTFQLGEYGGITLMGGDGKLLIQWPSMEVGRDLSKFKLFREKRNEQQTGYYRGVSPFDGVTKYMAFERLDNYPLLVMLSRSESAVLANWRSDLRSDVVVAMMLLCTVVLLGALLSAQLRSRAEIELALREREQHYRLLADNIADVIVVLDEARTYRYVTPSVTAMLGWLPEQLIGTCAFDRMYPDDVVAVRRAEAQTTAADPARTVAFRMFRADGSIAWLEAHFRFAPFSNQEATDVVAVLRDITQRKAMEEQLNALNSRLAELATTDSLTGLANRRTLDLFVRREFAARQRVSVLLLDVDHFKGFNDSLGHQAGDECLKSISRVLAETTEGTDGLATRYGGEEFALVLPDLTETSALTVAETIRIKVHGLGIANPASEHNFVTVSIGVAAKHPDMLNEIALLGEADHALYEAKRRGRNCCITGSSLTELATLVPEHL